MPENADYPPVLQEDHDADDCEFCDPGVVVQVRVLLDAVAKGSGSAGDAVLDIVRELERKARDV